MTVKENFLFISDIHIPFENKRALHFFKSLKKDFEIPDSNIYSVGDILDLYNFSRWPKSPEAKHTVNQELDLARERIRKWVHAFPEMKIAESNHDQRIMKAAIGAQLPSQVIRGIEEIFEFPKNWQIKKQYVIMANKWEGLCYHGEEPFASALQAAISYGINVIEGHKHSIAGVQYTESRMQELWGLDTGCAIDREAYAFEYGDKSKKKPILGGGIVINGVPHFIPLK